MRDFLKDREVKQRRDPKNNVESERAEKFRKDHLPIVHRRGHEGLDCAKLKFFGEKPHRDERENQNEGEPKENRVKERFLHRVLHLALVHETELEIENDAADEQKKNQNDIRDGRVEVAAYFAHQEREKFSHNPDTRVIPNPAVAG
jgi:hypothetical protein